MADSETARLLEGQSRTASWWHAVCLRYRSSHFCVWSKAAIIILIWNFLLMFAVTCILPFFFQPLLAFVNPILMLPIHFGFISVLYLFYPLSGFLADVCCGRHKTVTVSLWVFVVGVATSVVLIAFMFFYISHSDHLLYIMPVSLLLLLIGLCGFQANAIQYGLDQLLDSPTACLSLFIYWYFWASYVGETLVNVLVTCTNGLLIDFNQFGTVFCVVNGVFAVSIVVTLSLSCCKRRWFIVDPGSRNPYKLVYRVLRFAAKNKCPIQRSAFTYCEDELPSRIDFGKHKYGGPFTTEEVEDVKTFLNIFSVLFAVGFAFTTEIAAYHFLHYTTVLKWSDYATSIFSLGSAPLFVVLFISLYIFLIRPLFSYYVPGVFKRMGLGMVFYLLAVCCSLVNETVIQIQHHNETCSERIDLNITLSSFEVYPAFVTQNIFCGIAFFFFYPSVFEFICSQSPHAMKGLLIGVYFAIRGVYLLFGVGIMIPFYFWTTHLFGCNLAYYLVNVFIAIVGLVVYTVAARRYKYRDRQRGDYPNIHLFAEEYYGNHQDEPRYDFDPID